MGYVVLFAVVVGLFTVWMFADCMLHKTKNKIFWCVIIFTTFPLGPILYAAQRSKLIGEREFTVQTAQGPITQIDEAKSSSVTSQLIRSAGITLGVIMAAGGLLFVAWIVFLAIIFSGLSSGLSGGNWGGSSK